MNFGEVFKPIQFARFVHLYNVVVRLRDFQKYLPGNAILLGK